MQPEFERLILQHSGRIKAIARRYADAGTEDDLYQEILEQLWRSFGHFRQQSKPETWIFRVGFNTAMTSLRKVIKQRKGVEKLQHLKPAFSVGEERCQADILEDFMTSLNDVDASILMMYLDGLNTKDMASVLGIRTNTIGVRISRIKAAFTRRNAEI